jgi:hypothetical protein
MHGFGRQLKRVEENAEPVSPKKHGEVFHGIWRNKKWQDTEN